MTIDVVHPPENTWQIDRKCVKTLPFAEALKTLSLPGLGRNLFSSAEWLRVIEKTYQTKLFVKYLEEEKEIASYIIYTVVRNFLEWKICICSYCDYFDCWVNGVEDWKFFFAALRSEYPRYRIAIRNLRDTVVRDLPELKILSQERFHFLDVRTDLDTIWKKTHDSFRSAVKQAQRSGVVVRKCTHKELASFYQFHLRLRKNKYRLFPQPYRFFENIWQAYIEKDKGVLLGAYDGKGNLMGANVYLICGSTLYYKFNTSSREALKFRPNNLLFWEGIKFAKERQLERIDLGSSGYEQEGLILFKNHTGAQCLDIVHLGFAPPDYKFSQKRILKVFTKTLTLPWMPDFMVRLGSSIIYPFLA